MAKLLLTIVGALIIQLYYIHAEGSPPKINPYTYCAEKAELTPEETVVISNTKYGFDINDYADNYNMKCYWNCFLEFGGLFRDGVFLYEKARVSFGNYADEQVRKYLLAIMDKCENSTDGAPNNCEAAYQHAVCTQYWANELNGKVFD